MVIEPMEDLFRAMVHSRLAYGRTLRKIIAALVLAVLAVLEGGMYYYDISQWRGMQERIDRLRTEGRYEQALQEVDAFSSPSWLQEAGGNRTAAAGRLGISRTTLWRMIRPR